MFLVAVMAMIPMISIAVTDASQPSEQNLQKIEEQNQENGEESANDTSTENISEELTEEMEFLYIESKLLKAPGTQNIVVSWTANKALEDVQNIILVYENIEGKEFTINESERTDKSILFKKDFSKTEIGAYIIKGIRYNADSEDCYLAFDDVKIDASFEVVSKEDVQEDTVVSVDVDNGIDKKEVSNDIEDAIVATTGESSRALKSTGVSKDVVVVLDPGHGGSDPGACKYGLKEAELNLSIAKACEEELSQYAGVKVYLTRTGSDGYSGSAAEALYNRAKFAADRNADLFVSIHINAGGGRGFEIYYPNGNPTPEIGNKGYAVAAEVQKEIKKLGLSDRGLKIRNANDYKYADGSRQDYYAVIRHSKNFGIPAILVEHAFIDNASDANFLSNATNVRKLGIADATGIAKALGLTKIGSIAPMEEATYSLQSVAFTDKVASISDSSLDNGATLVLGEKTETSNQRFELSSLGGNAYSIVAEHSGKAMNSKDGSTEPGTVVQQDEPASTSAQKWYFIYAGDNQYYIRSGDGMYLTAGENGVIISDLDKSTAQKWVLTKTQNRPVSDGIYSIKNGTGEECSMSVKAASLTNSANIQLDVNKNTSSQRFEVYYVGNGYYKILAEHSGKALDVASASKSNGVNLAQYGWNGTNAQLWKFIDSGNGKYYIRSKCGTVLDLASETPLAGTNIYLWKMSGKQTQQWDLSEEKANIVPDGEYVISNSSKEYQVVTDKNGNIKLDSYGNEESQKFKITHVANGYYTIALRNSGKAVDVASASSKSGANVQTYTANGTDAQLWKFIDIGNGEYYIKSKLGTAMDLTSGSTSSGTNIQAYAMNGTAAQKWKLDKTRVNVPEQPLENGTYTIRNSTNTNCVLDVSGASEANGANVQVYTYNNTSAQRFDVTYISNGYYKITCERSGKSVDVASASKKSGANVWQYVCNGTDAQLWRIIADGQDNYYIKSKIGNTLDISASKAFSGANVRVTSLTDSTSQKWQFEEAENKLIADNTYSIRVASSANQMVQIDSSSRAKLNTYNGEVNQWFDISYVSKGYYKLIAKHSGKALEYDSSVSRNGSAVREADYTGADNQLWRLIHVNNGVYYIQAKNGLVLDVTSGRISAGTKLQLYTMNGTAAQKWKFRTEKQYTATEVPEGTYVFRMAQSASKVLDVTSASKSNCANIQIYSDNGTKAQHFKVEKASGDYYRILSVNSGKAVDVSNGSIAPGANVWQYGWNGTNAQLWRFIDAGDGSYYIQSKLGTFLDTDGGRDSIKTNVLMKEGNESDSQKWNLDTNTSGRTLIMGKSDSAVIDKMVALYSSRRSDYPSEELSVGGASTIEQLATIFYQEASAEGVKPEVAWCQAMLETGWLRYGGQVKIEQFNFAGIGATDGGAAGADFSEYGTDGVLMGVRAQIQHLKAYASKDKLNEACVDPRFHLVTRGSAVYVEHLGQMENPSGKGWATTKDYGYKILKLINELKSI